MFNKPEQYISIVNALCAVNKGITRDEICRKTGIASSGELTKKLKELENCGFIRKYTPLGAISKNALYQLVDNYTLFYDRFLTNINEKVPFFLRSVKKGMNSCQNDV